jgi:hypothetical protein
MPDQTCGDPKLPASGGAPDVSSATGVLGVAHGGTGVDLSNGAAAKVLATPPNASGPLALRTLDLSAPGAIGGGTPAAITGTTITATGGFVGDGSGLTGLPSGGGGDAVTTLADGATVTTGGRYVEILSRS